MSKEPDFPDDWSKGVMRMIRIKKKLLISPFIINLRPEVAKWKTLDKVLRERINANAV